MIGKTNSEGVAVDIDTLTASPGDVRAGKKFVGSGTDETQTGTAVDRGAPTATLKCGEKYTIGSGIYNGGTITAATLASQTSGNATAADLKTGVKAWVGGVQLTGSMKNWAGTPNHIQSRRIANGRFEVAVDAGYHGCSWNGNSYEYMTYAEVASTLGLTAGNLAQGTTKCGLTGTYKGLGNAVAADVRKGKTFSSASLSNTTGTMAEQGGSTTTPGTANKTIVAANRYVTGNIVVAGDANLKAENIKKGVNIFGITGTHSSIVVTPTDLYNRGQNPGEVNARGTSKYNTVFETGSIRLKTASCDLWFMKDLRGFTKLNVEAYYKGINTDPDYVSPKLELRSSDGSLVSQVPLKNVGNNTSSLNISAIEMSSDWKLSFINTLPVSYVYRIWVS